MAEAKVVGGLVHLVRGVDEDASAADDTHEAEDLEALFLDADALHAYGVGTLH